MPLPLFIRRRLDMRRCVNQVMDAAAKLQQQQQRRQQTPTQSAAAAKALDTSIKTAVTAMIDASKLLIEQQQDNERQHYALVHTAASRKRTHTQLDDFANELIRPGSAAKRRQPQRKAAAAAAAAAATATAGAGAKPET